MDKSKHGFSLISLFTLRNSIKISFLICLINQLCFLFVLYQVPLTQKWIGFLLHLLSLIISLLSLKFFYEMTSKSFIRLRSLSQFSAIVELAIIVYYSIQIISMWHNNGNIDIILFFIFTLIILGLFKGLLITAIFAYLKTINERPMMVKGKGDKKFDEGKINQLKEDLIGN